MKPLRDDRASLDRGEWLLSTLFEAVPKVESDPFAKRRILAGVSRRSSAARRRGVTAIIVVSTLSLATGAFATALIVQWQTPRAMTQTLTPQELPSKAPPKAPEPLTRTEPPRDTTAPKHRGSVSVPSLHPVATAGEDPTLVAKAISALRNEHNPARARQLLSRYLTTNPRGALAEEALALSIEAAVAMQDPQVTRLARAYLASYPSGRHRALADHVIAQSNSK